MQNVKKIFLLENHLSLDKPPWLFYTLKLKFFSVIWFYLFFHFGFIQKKLIRSSIIVEISSDKFYCFRMFAITKPSTLPSIITRFLCPFTIFFCEITLPILFPLLRILQFSYLFDWQKIGKSKKWGEGGGVTQKMGNSNGWKNRCDTEDELIERSI